MNEAAYREAEQRLWRSVGKEPTERTARLERWSTDVRVQVVGDGPPVLFIHGGPNAGTTWAPLVGQLDGFRCYVVDRPGSGLSAPIAIGRADVEPYADHLVAGLLDGLGIDRAHVVASSVGGYFALRSAAATPARLDRMVQMGAPPFVPGMTLPAFMRLLMIDPVRRLITAAPANRRAGRISLKQIGHGASLKAGRITDELLDWSFSLQRDTDTMRNEGDLIGTVGSIRGADPSLTLSDSLLRSVTTPTLFLWGDTDPFGSVENARSLVTMMPAARLEVIEQSGHLPWLDDPARLAKATADFLGG